MAPKGKSRTPVPKSKLSAPIVSETLKNGIKVLSHFGNVWEVELFFPLKHVSEELLSQKLKEVKDLLVKKYRLTDQTLRYKKLIDTRIAEEGVYTMLRLEREFINRGQPKFHFQSAVSSEGISHNDMVCTATLFYLDEFDKELTLERLIGLLHQQGVPDKLLNMEMLTKALSELKDKKTPFEGLIVAQGIFPDTGCDAEVEFYFHANPGKENLNEYISSRKVEVDDLLCSKKPPTTGKIEGLSVRGKKISPGKGLDIQLIPGRNVRINIDNTQLIARSAGLVVVRREEKSFLTPRGIKVFPHRITVRIDPLLVIEASEKAVEIITNESVEIKGPLKMGSRIISSGEVHVEGDVGENSVIHASHDIIINGLISQGTLASDKNIIARRGIVGGRVTAGDNIIVNGRVNSSILVGKEVYANEIAGGEVYAGKQVTVDELGADERGISATICVGMKEFFLKKIEENQKFITEAEKNLDRLKRFFGAEIINEVRSQNVQQMLVKHLTQIRRDGDKSISPVKIETLRKLLTNVEPVKNILHEKRAENLKLRRQIEKSTKEKKMVIVKERIKAHSKITINDTTRIVEPQSGPLHLDEDCLKKIKA